MKKIILGLILGIGLTATTGVFASNIIQTTLFPAKFLFNGAPKEANGNEYVVLNHNGHVYVPVRFVAESMGALVKYEDTTKTISIDQTNLSKKLPLDKDFFSYVSEGKIKGIEFGIGSNKQDIVKEWGDPQKTGSWQTPYYSWFDYYYFFGNPDESVSAIRVGGDTVKYSVVDVKKIIGGPIDEGVNDVENGWYLYYEAGEYQVFFNADSKNGMIRYMTLKKK
ncbi:DUF4309 domain-containing protein [Paenibacillus allorhizosphaerae]|uniref:Copper amine oxidase-like N-terminal domain-containing protein n=1 Tax=Paenibacillus allorhizosphaerae TaxID=2849866 RepID=A0ABN7TEC3_9BACL|nr:DUF4309 domain-containing protein [Paenibacillus allorhizosphaerae]CAG7626163.1 hypothetical protein PAECIP111802_01222 [Paenibacillus allorhizosphaerae]